MRLAAALRTAASFMHHAAEEGEREVADHWNYCARTEYVNLPKSSLLAQPSRVVQNFKCLINLVACRLPDDPHTATFWDRFTFLLATEK